MEVVLRGSADIHQALAGTEILETTQGFVEQTMILAERGEAHQVAAAFCYGREEVIPEMFAKLAQRLETEGVQVNRLRSYLQRHIELDSSELGPLALQLVEHFCGSSERRWHEATDAAWIALAARIRLWDGILEAIDRGTIPASSD